MSRRKQANPARLGDVDVKMKIISEDCLLVKRIVESSDEKDDNEEDEDDSDTSELREMDNGCLENGEDEFTITLNGRTSSPSSSSQSSPISCQSFILSDATDGDEAYTVGATVTTPYECNKCKRAFAKSSLLTKHIQIHSDNLQFSCPYCRRLFKHKRSRDRHTKLHTGDKKYKCQHCESAFARSDHLKIHMKTHDNKKPHQCELCNRGYNTAAALASHQQHHIKKEVRCESSTSTSTAISSPSPGYIRCSQCFESFPKPELFQVHQNTCKHKLTQPLPINQQANVPDKNSINVLQTDVQFAKLTCVYCGKDFSSMNQMYQHISLDHGATLFSQSLTNYDARTSMAAKDPSQTSHQQSNLIGYTCDLCAIKFDTSQTLREHLKMNHSNLGSNAEDSVNLLQSKPTDLSRKRRVEDLEEKDKRKSSEERKRNSPSSGSSPYDSNDKPCICSYCYVQTPNFKSFLVHMEGHVSLNTSSNFIGYCPICGEPSRDPIEFSSHIFEHVMTAMNGRCCHQCKKSFDQLEQLQKHHLDVHSQNVYKCTICGELFESEIAIKVHFNNKHCTECKHYRCNICSQQYFHDKLTAELHVSMRHGTNLSNTTPDHQQHQHLFSLGHAESESRLLYGQGSYQCTYCQKSFRDEYMHHFHVLKEHDLHDGRKGENILMDISPGLASSCSPNFSFGSSSPTHDSLKIDMKLSLGCHNSCEICHRGDFATEADLMSHMKIHQSHAKSKVGSLVSLQCAYCNEHCKSRGELENHMKGHQVSCSGKSKHKCNICDEIFSSAMTLADHKLTHCKIVSGNTCTQCKAVLVDEQCYYTHQLQHNNNNSTSTLAKSNSSQIALPANCVICCQTLQTDIEVKLHAKFHLRHLLQKEFICSMCNKVYDSQDTLEKFNGDSSVSICKSCKNGGIGYHLPPQQDIKSLRYDMHCLKKAFASDKEDDYIKTNTLEDMDNLICRLCRNILPSITKLQIHLIEHNFMGVGQFRCYICSSVFTTASGLQGHIIGHGLSQSPYECVDCKVKFFFESELENHRISHAMSSAIRNNQPSPSSNAFCEKIQGEKQFKICCYCSGTFLDVCFAEHVENCCKIEVKMEVSNSNDKQEDSHVNSEMKKYLIEKERLKNDSGGVRGGSSE